MSERKKRSNNSKTSYQSLEARNLLASITFDSGTLIIGGSQDRDEIFVTERADGQTEVALNDRASEFFASDSLESIRIFSKEGDDDVVIQRESDFQTQLTNLQTVFVSAGAGDDSFDFAIPGTTADLTAIGGLGDDTLSARVFPFFVVGAVPTNSFSFYGNEGNDVLNGGGGNDVLSGQAGKDQITGGAGDDVLNGGAGNDILRGDDGVDRLLGGDGDDSLEAGGLFRSPPNDVAEHLVGGDGNDFITGGDSIDLILGGAGRDIIIGNDGDDIIYGGDNLDQIHGGRGDDLIAGQNGNDIIYGEEGRDRIFGNEGRDSLYGGLAADLISGGADDDFLSGGLGDDSLNGGDGDDRLVGDEGNDLISGSNGNDFANGGGGDDTVFGGEGDDILVGFLGRDFLAGQAGNDRLSGQQGSDTILGGEGDDRIEGGRGFDRVVGNGGVDTFIYPESDRIVDFDAATERQTLAPYLDRYLGLTLEDATELAVASGLQSSPPPEFSNDLFWTNADGIVTAVISTNAVYAPELSDFIGENLEDAIETAVSYGYDVSTFDVSAGEEYSVIEPENPLRFLTANGIVLGVDGPRSVGFINQLRLIVQPRTDLYLGLTRSEATILAEANGNIPVFTIVDGVDTGDRVFQVFSRIIFNLEDGLVSRADGLDARDV